MDLGLSGRRAVVTGGSKGIGLAVAHELVAEGADVAICARHAEEVEAAHAPLAASGRRVHAAVADVTGPDQIAAFIAGSAEALGGIDVLVNNAGAAHPGTFATLTDEDWKSGFFATTVNRAACLNFSKALAMELGPEAILVNSVNIGFVVTPQWERIRAKRAPDLDAETFFARWAEAEVPLGRFGTVEEVSGLVAFLASGRAGYITGASIDVSGGMGRYV